MQLLFRHAGEAQPIAEAAVVVQINWACGLKRHRPIGKEPFDGQLRPKAQAAGKGPASIVFSR